MTDPDSPSTSSPEPTTGPGHLIMVGLPGAGKSTVGRIVARTLGWPFLDFDLEIARRAGKSIVKLFADEGETAFRARELALTMEVRSMPPLVMAPGGGWVTIPDVLALVRPPARIVHLSVSPEAALLRLARSRMVRPLLRTNNPRASMESLWASRAGLYAQADLVIDVERVDSQHVIQMVVALARDLTTGLG